LRRGVWGEKFDMFLPLIINEIHAKRARPILLDNLKLFDHRASPATLVLKVIPKLMNSMIVTLMKNNSEEKLVLGNYFVERHISERALLGYCSFHHMLLYFTKKYPEIQDRVNKKVAEFLNNKEARSKEVVPDMGEFLATMSVSSYSWGQVGKTVIKEIFERNVLWNSKKKIQIRKYIPTG